MGTCELTLPVHSHSRVPEVVAQLVSRHPLHSMCGFERVQHNTVLLYLPPVYLLHKEPRVRQQSHIVTINICSVTVKEVFEHPFLPQHPFDSSTKTELRNIFLVTQSTDQRIIRDILA